MDMVDQTRLDEDTWHLVFGSRRVKSTNSDRLIYVSPGPWRRVEAVHISTEYFSKIALSQGAVFLHGSSFVVDDICFVVLGPKGSGKTHWLVTALALCNGWYIGNDQLYVRTIDQQVTTRRWRPDVKIRAGTLRSVGLPVCADIHLWFASPRAARAFDTKEYATITGSTVYGDEDRSLLVQPTAPTRIDAIVLPVDGGPDYPRLMDASGTASMIDRRVFEDN